MNLCLNDGSYAAHIYELTREICDRYEQVDGVFTISAFYRGMLLRRMPARHAGYGT